MSASLSRFSVLRIEDDEDERAAQRARDKQRSAMLKLIESKKKPSKAQMNADRNEVKKSKAAQERAELKALAFGTSKPKKSSNSKKKSSVTEQTPADWSEWKQRDQQFVEGNFEAQLKEALIASKIDYEKQKSTSKTSPQKDLPVGKEVSKKKSANKKGTTTMSLDEFKQGSQQTKESSVVPSNFINGTTKAEDEHFFDEITDEAKKIASKEKSKIESSKKHLKKQKEDIQPRVAQLQEELNNKIVEIENLTSENEKLREELLNVKNRNKRLCSILVQGEMKEKAELIVEMEKMSKVKDELTAELENLSSQLQQERSKVSALTDQKKTTLRR